MYIGFCVPCFLIVQTVEGVHQWNVKVKTLFTALYVHPPEVDELRNCNELKHNST